MKAETYKARLKFLQENSISTADDLNACVQQAESTVTQLAKQRTILNVRKKKRKKLFDALAAEESLAVSKARKKKRISTSSLRSSTSRSAPSGRRSSCAVRLRIRQRSCSAMSLHRKNPYTKKKQSIRSQAGGDSPST